MYKAMLTWTPKVSSMGPKGLILRIVRSYVEVPKDLRLDNTIVVDLPGRMLRMKPEEAIERFKDRERLILGDRERVIHRGSVLKAGKDEELEVHVPYEDLKEVRSMDFPTLDDLAMIQLSRKIGAHAFLLSMVFEPSDVEKYARYLPEDAIKIAKIESVAALRNLEAIAEVADGIIIARGDLYLNAGPEGLIEAYERIKRIIESKLVYIGSGFLESLSRSPWPDRAEIMDLYYALSLGIDGVLFTGVSKSAPKEALMRFEKVSKMFPRTQCITEASTFEEAFKASRSGCLVKFTGSDPKEVGKARLLKGVLV